MSVTVKIYGQLATIEEKVWTSENKSLEKLLAAMLPGFSPGPESPFPDYEIAEQSIAELGGEIVRFDPPPAYTDGRVY